MEVKKSNQANLENKRTLFILLGFVIVLAFILVAFEWSTPEKTLSALYVACPVGYEEDLAIVTRVEKEKILPKPPLPEIKLVIKEDLFLEEDPIPIENIDVTQKTAIDIESLFGEDPEPNPSEYFIAVEEPPTFKGGGEENFMAYISKRIKYPNEAKTMGLSGKILARFIVNEKGEVINITIIKGIDPLLDNAVIDALSKSPKWNPGKQRGKPVKVMFNIPFTFKLE